ncbi:S1 family peptidase [Actinokineospora diospyrosa]|uniref:Streptogrisin C n=1 Tax=Actinokineospora diospyrosa TaxID=103728 RepID=A0ABT1IJZ1_9PSEU|nr:S1 family peptidase [Actinokineospora diospyrosa]MCP2272966.1 streptogrisin C [Actinokineospora diospyrosa]
MRFSARFLTALCAIAFIVLTAPTASAGQILVGGDRIVLNGKVCVIGFNARTPAGARKIITSGACAGTTAPVGVVDAPADSTSTPLVRTGPASTAVVKGATEAAIGAQVCRYGPTTGWRCGVVQAKNQTVNYPGGTVTGLTRTSMCVEPGDAGGPVLAGNQAQGVIVGGSGNCTSGGTSYFLPIRHTLSAYGLVLYTG